MKQTELDWLIGESKTTIDQIATHFCFWLETHFVEKLGPGYWVTIKSTLGKTEDERRNLSTWNKITDLDLSALLKITFRNLVYIRGDSYSFKKIIPEMQRVRNEVIGHFRIRGITFNLLHGYLNTTLNFSQLIDTPDYIQQRIKDLKERAGQFDLADKGQAEYPGIKTKQNKGLAPRTMTVFQPSQNIIEIFKGYDLSSSQSIALNSLKNFLENSEEQCFILNGYAGTGKTFLIGGLIKYLTAIKQDYCVMAPTGRAARILSESHGIEASTIHRIIYYMKELKEYQDKDDNGRITYKYYFSLSNNEYKQGTIFIVDEASMVSDVYNEQEFLRFGSGRVLSDLLSYVNFDCNDYKKKIIFVGDNAQLPPISMNSSPALDEKYLIDTYNLRAKSATLSDVIRQKEDSQILKFATIIRKSIDQKIFNEFNYTPDGKEVKELDPEHFIKEYLTQSGNENDPNCLIITYSNSAAASYNKAIRKYYFPNKDMIEIGDRVLVIRNHYSSAIDIMNGQIGTICDINPVPEKRVVPLNVGKKDKGGRNIKYIELSFRKMYISFIGIQQKEHILPFMVLENLLYNDESSLSSEESKALYVDFTKRNPTLRPQTEDFKQALNSDPYFNSLQIKYGYAITCHKAQGGAWKKVFVDFAGKHSLTVDSLRWSYTAVTRAEERLFVTNMMHYSILRPVDMSYSDLEIQPDETELIPVENSIEGLGSTEYKIPEDLKNSGDPLYIKTFIELKKRLPIDVEYVSSLHRAYLEQFEFKWRSKKVMIKVIYNKKKIVTNVSVLSDIQPNDFTLLFEIKGIQLIDGLEQKGEQYDPSDVNSDILQAIIDMYKCFGMSLKINHQTEFHYINTVHYNGEFCEMNLYIDKKHRITKITPCNPVYNKIIYNRVLRLHLDS